MGIAQQGVGLAFALKLIGASSIGTNQTRPRATLMANNAPGRAISITVADLLMQGAEAADASCLRFGEIWRVPFTMLPSATTLAKIEELLICPTCGGREIDIAPTWPGDAQMF